MLSDSNTSVKISSMEVPDNDLIYLLGMNMEDAQKALGKSDNDPFIMNDGTIMLNIDDISLNCNSNGYVISITCLSGVSSSKTLCGISIGDNIQDVAKQMKALGAVLKTDETIKDTSFPYINQIYSFQLSETATANVWLSFNLDTKKADQIAVGVFED